MPVSTRSAGCMEWACTKPFSISGVFSTINRSRYSIDRSVPPAAIEGVVRQRSTSIQRLAVDTHGHTHLGLCLCKLLGFDLCPRLYDMRHQWLHVPRDWPEVPGLEPILRRDIDLDVIHAELPELLRIAASINDDYGSATFLLERLGSAARGSRLHRAGTQFGQLWGAVYLCDYAAQQPFRRSIHRILVRGESVHQGLGVHSMSIVPFSNFEH